jgi:pilus assembly protein Flp/PilA
LWRSGVVGHVRQTRVFRTWRGRRVIAQAAFPLKSGHFVKRRDPRSRRTGELQAPMRPGHLHGNVAHGCNVFLSNPASKFTITSAGGVLATRATEGSARRQGTKGSAQFQEIRNCGIAREEILMSIKDKVLAFLKEEEGLTTVEYAVAGSVLAAGVIAAFILLGGNVNRVIAGLNTAVGKVPTPQ